MTESSELALFTGNANPALAHDIARHLRLPVGRASVGRFSDGEVNIEIMENVRGRDVFIMQPTGPARQRSSDGAAGDGRCLPACVGRRTSPPSSRIFGYARQDRRPRAALGDHREAGRGHDRTGGHRPAADARPAFGSDSGLFSAIPVDNVYASPVLLGDVWKQSHANLIVVSPGRRRRRTSAGNREATGRCGPRDHRQAPSASQ